MKKYNRILIYVIINVLIYTSILLAQTTEECLIGPSGALAKQQTAPNGDPVNYTNFIPNDTISIRLKIHRVSYSSGTDGLSDAEIEEAIDSLNSFFEPVKMKFVPLDLIDDINNNTYAEYDLGTNIHGCDGEINKNIFRLNEDPNAINIYFIPKLKEGDNDSGVRGFAEGYGENSFLVRNSSAKTVTIAHEMGHSFNLYHPHDTCAFGQENIIRDTFDGCYNADTAGDKLSDTPADPGNKKYQDADCNFNATNPDPDLCDATNYDPDMYNIMSYYKDYCRTTFTPQQIGKMHDWLSSSLHYTKNVKLSNEISDANQTGTQLYIDNNAINSGGSTDLFVDVRYNIRTGSEIINSTHKHHDWDGVNTQFRLSEDFLVEENTEQRVAKFIEINTGYIKNNIIEAGGIDLGSKQFKDPWWVDAGNNQPDSYRNLSSSESAQSLFLYQNPQFQQGLPNYSVKSDQTQNIDLSQTGKTHKFYFQNWSGSNVNIEDDEAFETAVVFNANNAEVKANYKGTQLSDNSNAYVSSSQRKFVYNHGGSDCLASVYESMGKIWLEGSEDGGATWQILNNGQPLNGNTTASNPSIDNTEMDGHVVVVYQESNDIKISIINLDSDDPNPIKYTGSVHPTYAGNTIPVVKSQFNYSNNTELYLIVWKEDYINPLNSPGLYYRCLERLDGITDTYYFINNKTKISNTDANSTNPALAAKYNHTYLHIAWEQQLNTYESEIRYYKINRSSTNTLSFSYYYKPSLGNVFLINSNPTMTVVDNGGMYMTWVGSSHESEDPPFKQVIMRCRHTGNWWYSTFFKYGSAVNNVSINSAEYPNQYYYGLAWVENGSTNYYKASTISGIQTLNTTGNYVQLANGLGSCNNMQAMTFKNTSIPYTFTVSEKFGTGLSKSKSTQDFEGREGIVNYPVKDSEKMERYYFTFNNVEVDGNPIKFIELDETVMVNNLNDLNMYLTTETFEISSLSELTYNATFGLSDGEKEEKLIDRGKKVKFSVELIDSENEKVLGIYDEIDFKSGTILSKNKKACKIIPKLKKNKKVKLRLVVEDQEKGQYLISSIMSKSKVLSKEGTFELVNGKNLVVSEYQLAQNYPNPFNPETKITYQLPKDGMVTLKVFDALGKEVAELVNDYKSSGSYDVIFDGSNLASGIYFYKLSSGAFTDTKKLILMK